MSLPKRALKYAKSLFRTVSTTTYTDTNLGIVPNVCTVGEELFRIRGLFLASVDFKNYFQNPTYSEQSKSTLITSLIPAMSRITVSFLSILKERGHLSLLPEISDEYEKIFFRVKEYTKIRITLSGRLEQKYGKELVSMLKEVTPSKKFLLNASYNPKLLGGLVVEYNSSVLDASVLKELGDTLT